MDVCSKNNLSCVTTIEHLPNEPLYLIFKKLDKGVDRKSFGLTCHCFLDMRSSSVKCLKIGCSIQSECSSHVMAHDSVIIEKLLNCYTPLESLSFGSCLKITDSHLTPLIKYGSKLRSIYLDYCSRLTDVGLASGCPLLSIISLAQSYITDSGLEILTNLCKSLEVKLASCKKITDWGILSLNQNCRQLKSLVLRDCTKITALSFQGFSPTLAYLETTKFAFESEGVIRILSGGGLKHLNLSHLYNKFFLMQNLVECIEIGSAEANLKFLNLKMCTFVDDNVVMNISKGCPLLQEWNLSGCDKIGIFGWESIGSYCKNLEILYVSYCPKLCD